MLNFGLGELRLVDPQCDWLSDDAKARASGARLLLDAATVFSTVEEASSDLHATFATTARLRDVTMEVGSLRICAYTSVSKLTVIMIDERKKTFFLLLKFVFFSLPVSLLSLVGCPGILSKVITPHEMAQRVVRLSSSEDFGSPDDSEVGGPKRCGLIFGPERSGLTNVDVESVRNKRKRECR